MAASPGNTREVADSHYLGNPTLSRIIKNQHLFIALVSCPQKETVLSYPEGQFHDRPMPIIGHGISELSWESARLIQKQLIANQVHLFFITNSSFPIPPYALISLFCCSKNLQVPILVYKTYLLIWPQLGLLACYILGPKLQLFTAEAMNIPHFFFSACMCTKTSIVCQKSYL